jgi:hypothetical protein
MLPPPSDPALVAMLACSSYSRALHTEYLKKRRKIWRRNDHLHEFTAGA